MKIMTKNFGEIEFKENKKITFEKGIPGFREYKSFIIIEDPESAFANLQSIDDERISFIIINPYLLIKDYVVDIPEKYIAELGGGKQENYSVYVIATILGEVEQATVNLVAPLIIQTDTRKGIQIILENTKYSTRHKLIELINEGGVLTC